MKKKKDLLQKGAEAPAEFLDRSIVTTQKLTAALPANRLVKKTGNYWHMLGPGLTTGASDDDPSGIATYSQTGAQFGYQFLWLSAWTFPLMSIVQEMCARIGLVTGRGLAGNIRVHFSKKVLIVCTMLLFAANAINIGANLGAMAKAVQLLNPHLNFGWLVLGFTALSLGLQIFTPYVRYARYLKWMALVLLAYILSALLADLDWSTILASAVVPHLPVSKEAFILLCAVLGTTISPYLFFWQTSQEVEEQILQGKTTLHERRTATAPEDIKSMRIDVWSGMFLSNIVMFFIIAACGGILHVNGVTNIESAAQAAEALRPFAGDATYFLFAAGIIGTGLLAIPVLAGATSYAFSETYRWREGLYRPLGQAHAFYGIMIISMFVGLAINFLSIDPIKALIYSAFLNGLVAPIILTFILLISSNKKVMGRWVNRRSTTIIGWTVTTVMALSGIAGLWALL
jgi:Mn2+/Fe2+ NRAMP family transporter